MINAIAAKVTRNAAASTDKLREPRISRKRKMPLLYANKKKWRKGGVGVEAVSAFARRVVRRVVRRRRPLKHDPPRAIASRRAAPYQADPTRPGVVVTIGKATTS